MLVCTYVCTYNMHAQVPVRPSNGLSLFVQVDIGVRLERLEASCLGGFGRLRVLKAQCLA